MFDHKLHEECGVFGVWSPQPANLAEMSYYGLYALQHRGQESAGIAVSDGQRVQLHKALGLVAEVFPAAQLERFAPAKAAVGHVRYATTGGAELANAQPVCARHLGHTLAVVHNGNLTNTAQLRHRLEKAGSIFHASSDTEVISHLVVRALMQEHSLTAALHTAMQQMEGAYSLLLMTETELVAARDKNGFRPLCYGKTADGCHVLASESCALDIVGAEWIRDLLPGEILSFGPDGITSDTSLCQTAPRALCVFEYIYFARPDSSIEGCSVQEARQRAGSLLAKAHPVAADVVIGVPDSGLDAAIGYARCANIPYGLGFIKNKYIGRTFIAPGQEARENLVRIKLNPIAETVRGKRVVMIDDSIVRGTTSRHIVALLRKMGATEVHVRISSPPFLYPCYFGTDVDSSDTLLANQHSTAEICAMIGADSLGFLREQDLPYLTSEQGQAGFCTACFSGNYPVAVDGQIKKDSFS